MQQAPVPRSQVEPTKGANARWDLEEAWTTRFVLSRLVLLQPGKRAEPRSALLAEPLTVLRQLLGWLVQDKLRYLPEKLEQQLAQGSPLMRELLPDHLPSLPHLC